MRDHGGGGVLGDRKAGGRGRLGELQVDGTEGAGEQVQLFLGKGNRAVERALQARGEASGQLEAGVGREEVEVGQKR